MVIRMLLLLLFPHDETPCPPKPFSCPLWAVKGPGRKVVDAEQEEVLPPRGRVRAGPAGARVRSAGVCAGAVCEGGVHPVRDVGSRG